MAFAPPFPVYMSGTSRSTPRDYVNPLLDFNVIAGDVVSNTVAANNFANMQRAVDAADARKVPLKIPSATIRQAGLWTPGPTGNSVIQGFHPGETIFKSQPSYAANGPLFDQRQSGATWVPVDGLRISGITFDGDWANNVEYTRTITPAVDITPSTTTLAVVESTSDLPTAGRMAIREAIGSNSAELTWTGKTAFALTGVAFVLNSHSAPATIPAGTAFYNHTHTSLGLFHMYTWNDLVVEDCVFQNSGGYCVGLEGHQYDAGKNTPKLRAQFHNVKLGWSHHSDSLDCKWAEDFYAENITTIGSAAADKAINVRGPRQRYVGCITKNASWQITSSATVLNQPFAQATTVVGAQPNDTLTVAAQGNIGIGFAGVDTYDDYTHGLIGAELVAYEVVSINTGAQTAVIRLLERGLNDTRPAVHAIHNDSRAVLFSPCIDGGGDVIDSTVDMLACWAIADEPSTGNGIVVTGSGTGGIHATITGGGATGFRRGLLLNDSRGSLQGTINGGLYTENGDANTPSNGCGMKFDSCLHVSVNGAHVVNNYGDNIQVVNCSNGAQINATIAGAVAGAGVHLTGNTDYVDTTGSVMFNNELGDVLDQAVVA